MRRSIGAAAYTAAVAHPPSVAVLLLGWDFVVYLVPLPLIVLANLAETATRSAPRRMRVAGATLIVLGVLAALVGVFASTIPLLGTLPALVGLALFAVGGSIGLGLWLGARQAAWVALVVVGLAGLIYGIAVIAGGQPANGAAVVASGALALLTAWRRFRSALARILPIDPDSVLDATAVMFTVLMVGTQVGAQLSGNVLETLSKQQSLHPIDLVVQDLPFVLAALLGVGLLIRRRPGAVLRRLGIVRPAWWQIVLALACAGAFYAFSTGADLLASRLTPDLAQKVAAANQQIFGQLANPIGIATIALTAGLSEEMLFRGALQPRLGLVWVALVFAAIHSQYGLSLDAVAVFILAIGLGLLRRFANTTTTIVCHVIYNAVVGVGLANVLPVPLLVIAEGLLLAALAVAVVIRPRRPEPELYPS
jgi:membrane protease YdiL (CAAX protease family)